MNMRGIGTPVPGRETNDASCSPIQPNVCDTGKDWVRGVAEL